MEMAILSFFSLTTLYSQILKQNQNKKSEKLSRKSLKLFLKIELFTKLF